jgi:hypothetical protein
MGDFIRFLASNPCSIDFKLIVELLNNNGAAFSILADVSDPNIGELLHDTDILAEIEINADGDEIFEEDISDLMEILDETAFPQKEAIMERLNSAQIMVAIQLTEAGHEAYDLIDPLWDALLGRCAGILQVDDEGFYDQNGELLVFE